MTLREIKKCINAYRKKEENRLKERAVMDFKLAYCISQNVASILVEENKPAALLEVYKDLFQKENKELEKLNKANELEIQKQRMKDFANFHNRNFKRKEE